MSVTALRLPVSVLAALISLSACSVIHPGGGSPQADLTMRTYFANLTSSPIEFSETRPSGAGGRGTLQPCTATLGVMPTPVGSTFAVNGVVIYEQGAHPPTNKIVITVTEDAPPTVEFTDDDVDSKPLGGLC